jgi:hypothetical protein
MARLDYGTAGVIMVHALRCPEVAQQLLAAGVTGMDFIGTAYEPFAVVVDALQEYRRGQTDAPPQQLLTQLCARIVYNNQHLKRLIPDIRDFLNGAYRQPGNSLRPGFVSRTNGMLQNLIDELKIAPLTRKIALELDPERRDALLIDLQRLRSATRVTAAQHTDIFDPETMARLTALSQKLETGLDFIDKAVGGIPRVSLNGLIAGTGGGKTMYGTMRVCESVLRGRNTVLFQYEQALEGDIAERFYSYVGGAARDELEGGYRNYSEELRQRIREMRPLFQRHFRLFAMAGDVDNQGNGGVDEIDALLTQLRQRDGWAPDLVVVDWLEPLWTAWEVNRPRTRTKDKREEYKLIINSLKRLRDKWKCNFDLLHQIAPGHMERLTPAMVPDKTMAEEVKSFPNMMNNCFCFGKKEEDTNCMWFVVSKGRSSGNPKRIVRMEAMRNRIVDAHGLYELNEAYNVSGEPTFIARRARR